MIRRRHVLFGLALGGAALAGGALALLCRSKPDPLAEAAARGRVSAREDLAAGRPRRWGCGTEIRRRRGKLDARTGMVSGNLGCVATPEKLAWIEAYDAELRRALDLGYVPAMKKKATNRETLAARFAREPGVLVTSTSPPLDVPGRPWQVGLDAGSGGAEEGHLVRRHEAAGRAEGLSLCWIRFPARVLFDNDGTTLAIREEGDDTYLTVDLVLGIELQVFPATWVLPAHLPCGDSMPPREEGCGDRRTFRLTLEWDSNLRQAKMYVGPKYTGFANAESPGDLRATESEVRDLLARGEVDRAELDAHPRVPFGIVIAAMDMLLRAGVAETRFAAFPPEEPEAIPGSSESRTLEPPPATRGAPFEGTPARHEEILVERDRRFVWMATDAPAAPKSPTQVTVAELGRRLDAAARRKPDPVNHQLSTATVLVRADRLVRWVAIATILQECAKVGIWRIEFAVAPPASETK